ncbi:MAG: transketolase family protein [Clostridia bacterium]|jgi:transketolase|nr:transketolase family protein [Clostridia bacterium]
MNIKLAENRLLEETSLADAYLDTLLELARSDESVMSLEADLMKSIGVKFIEKFPKRTINCGIAEANMVGVATGLGAVGMKAYTHTFAPFLTRRAYDQIFITTAYGKGNVKLIGSDPGITAAYNGGTHMPFEDAGLLRMVPDAIVIDISDSTMLKCVLKDIKDIFGVQYVRMPRCAVDKIYACDSVFDIGKGIVLKDGTDATIIASGILVSEALDAAHQLEQEGISARVVDMFTWKPIDKDLIVKCAKETGAIVTAENHNIVNGLGSAVAEVLGENSPVIMSRIGCKDRFGEVGSKEYLMDEFEMTADDIAKQVKVVLNQK